jgi:hypothetical protein
MKITTARDNRVGTVSTNNRCTAQQQTRGKQNKLKQGSSFHDSDSFSGFLMKQ